MLFDEVYNDKNYTGIFFNHDSMHMTWEYGSNNHFPSGVKSGDHGVVEVIGQYQDKEIKALIVQWEGKLYQPSGIPLHITLLAEGVPPVESGRRIKEKGYKPIPKTKMIGVWK